jgi:hypothetical protein
MVVPGMSGGWAPGERRGAAAVGPEWDAHVARTGEGERLMSRPRLCGSCGPQWAVAPMVIDGPGPLLGAWPDETVPAFN